MSNNCEIIICTEYGPLENMAKLLIYTIRNFTNTFKNTPIYSYQPRSNKRVSESTIKFFEDNFVHYIDQPLNKKYIDYPLANKPLACAHREKYSSAKYLLFLDSDTLFLNEPHFSNKLDSCDVAMNPTDFTNIATDAEFCKGESTYWRDLYNLLGVKRRRTVKTTIDKKQILEYYNSGCIFAVRSTGLFSQWLENFKLVMDKGLKPNKSIFFTEQSVLSATIAQMNLNVKHLGRPYNYPVSGYSRKWRGFYPFSLKGVHHIHYHKLFHEMSGKNPIKNKLRSVDNGNEIIAKIKACF